MTISRPPSAQPIPPHAKCVFKGILFNVYQWEQADFNGKTQIFEKLTRPDTAVVIPLTPDGKIMYSLQEQPGKQPFFGLFGGRVDEGENVLEAAKRELREETGYEADEWMLFDAVQPTSKIDWCIYTFVAKGCRKTTEQHLDGGEKIDIHFASFEKFLEIATRHNFEEDQVKTKCLEALIDPKKMAELKKTLS